MLGRLPIVFYFSCSCVFLLSKNPGKALRWMEGLFAGLFRAEDASAATRILFVASHHTTRPGMVVFEEDFSSISHVKAPEIAMMARWDCFLFGTHWLNSTPLLGTWKQKYVCRSLTRSTAEPTIGRD